MITSVRLLHLPGRLSLGLQARTLARRTRTRTNAAEQIEDSASGHDENPVKSMTSPDTTTTLREPGSIPMGFRKLEDLDHQQPIRIEKTPSTLWSPQRKTPYDWSSLAEASGASSGLGDFEAKDSPMTIKSVSSAHAKGGRVLVRKVQQEIPVASKRAAVEAPKEFADLGLSPELVDKLKKAGIEMPTEIQAELIPALLSGKDVIMKSETGTGKTLGFILGLLSKLDQSQPSGGGNPNQSLKAIILVPTRELAFQTYQWIKHFANPPPEGGNYDSLVQCVVNDGTEINAVQQQRLVTTVPQILVGTGHRLDALAKANQLPSLFRIELMVVDEVDKVLGALTSHAPAKKVLNRELHPKPGAEFLDYVIANARNRYQTVVASATANASTRALLMKRNWIKDPTRIQVSADDVTLPANVTHQFVYAEREQSKLEMLKMLAKDPSFTAGLIFVSNQTGLLRFCNELVESGLEEVYPLSDAYQHESTFGLQPKEAHTQDPGATAVEENLRITPVSGLLDGKIKFVVGMEDMSRGLDLPNISHVIVMTLPKEMQSFLHESGRTGRMNKSGSVIAFYDKTDIMRAKTYAGYLNLPQQVDQISLTLKELDSEEKRTAEKPVILPNEKRTEPQRTPQPPQKSKPKEGEIRITYRK